MLRLDLRFTHIYNVFHMRASHPSELVTETPKSEYYYYYIITTLYNNP